MDVEGPDLDATLVAVGVDVEGPDLDATLVAVGVDVEGPDLDATLVAVGVDVEGADLDATLAPCGLDGKRSRSNLAPLLPELTVTLSPIVMLEPWPCWAMRVFPSVSSWT